MSFETLHIRQEYLEILKAEQLSVPTNIQQQAIPALLAGQDVIAQSQTGTGKTLAYLLPVLQKIDTSTKDVQAVVLVPTRELGMQILREIEMLTAGSDLRSQALIGGAALNRQIERLRLRPHIVVATPGRILELIKMRKLTMHFVKMIIVDEVDQVFDLGSVRDVETVFKGALRDRQIAFFSATIPEEILQLGKRWMNDPVIIKINPSQQTAEEIEHLYFVCEERDKTDYLRRLVRLYNPQAAIVFVTGTQHILGIKTKLSHHGINADILYGEAGKVERATVLNGFRQGAFQVLIATDVAARGLDIDEVSHVINFDLPIDADHYVHRVGRTGRAGQSGTAISIVTDKEERLVSKYAQALGIEISSKRMYKGKIVGVRKQ